MSHRISIEKGRELTKKELEFRQMQKKGISLPVSRRQKKYELMRKKQDGFLWRLKDRIKQTGGEMPEHLKEAK